MVWTIIAQTFSLKKKIKLFNRNNMTIKSQSPFYMLIKIILKKTKKFCQLKKTV